MEPARERATAVFRNHELTASMADPADGVVESLFGLGFVLTHERFKVAGVKD